MKISTIGRKRAEPEGVESINALSLERKLRKRVAGEVRFDTATRALYATDGSNYRQVPIGVVLPKSVEDIEETVALCREFGAPLLSRGGGTSLAGQCCNVAVVMDMSKYFNQILEINPGKKSARVRPGLVLDNLRKATGEGYGLTFGPDPATHNHCTLGGMLGNNSCGIHSVLAQFRGGGPRTSDNTLELEVLAYDGTRLRVGPTGEAESAQIAAGGGRRGEIYSRLKKLGTVYADLIRARFPNIPRRVSGYNLDELLPEKGFNVARALVGSESTCVVILEATLQLIDKPKVVSLLSLGYPDVYSAGRHVCEIMEHEPNGLEGIDHKLIGYMEQTGLHKKNLKLLPPGRGWLLVEFGGDSKREADAKARDLMEELKRMPDSPSMKLFDDDAEEEQVWKVRESGLGATAFVPNKHDNWPGWEDSAVPPERVSDYLRDLRELFKQHAYDASLYGHFGQGCIHCRIPFELTTAEGVKNYLRFTEKAADLVVRYGGSISGEHGDGQARGELLQKMFGPELCRAFAEFKSIWDPDGKMNPGKVVNAWSRDTNLRLGTAYHPWAPGTHFKFPDDKHSFARAALRCVGVGKCRRDEGGTMCPSYMVTREEMHTTRGRAHLLFEMLQGEVITDQWRSREVHESLHLCLACKGCKGDCPVKVDMATYKAEFLSHYYKHRVRPPHMFAFGLIHNWARAASVAPHLANFLSQHPLFSGIGKFLVGVAPQRRLPPFAVETFKQWFRRRRTKNEGRPRVLLFADTFNNYFHPNVSRAAVEVLEDAGFQVVVPRGSLCCGRPLYDFGMLDTAERWLKRILEALRDEIRGGTPMVVLEPSCCAVFRDELTGLFPHDQDAARLSCQTFTLSEFLCHTAPGYPSRRLDRKALVHMHCHHRAIMKVEAESELLERAGVRVEIPDEGCCGMAGAFGFEKGAPYDVSIKCGERKLLPAVRRAADDELVIANGFSCHEQIAQRTHRKPLHLSEVLQMAIQTGVPPAMSEAAERGTTQMQLAGSLLGAAAFLAGLVIGFDQISDHEDGRITERDKGAYEK